MNVIVKEKSEKMNHVLFLDFDGPLFSDRYISYHHENRRPYPGSLILPEIVSYWKMDPLSVEMLNFLHSTFAFTTVISSSWKRHIDKEQCLDLFSTNGLMLPLADDWATIHLSERPWNSCGRASEINEYICRHQIGEYLILDDPGSGMSLDDRNNGIINHGRVVMVNPDLGIGSHDYKQMLHVVRHWAGIPERTGGLWAI